MIEKYEFRLFKKYLELVGETVPVTDRYTVAVSLRGVVGDKRFNAVRKLTEDLERHGLGRPFGSWEILGTYTTEEIQKASLFMVRLPLTHFAAEECGTKYDESATCPKCGLGSKQIGHLRIAKGRLPRARDLIRLWGGELVVSERLASLITSNHLSGCRLSSINTVRGVLETFHQLKVISRPLPLSTEVVFGEHPFDSAFGGHCICVSGEIAGSQPLCPVALARSSWEGTDFCQTEVFMSSRGGLFRPFRILMVSKKCFNLFIEAKIKGCKFEVVQLV